MVTSHEMLQSLKSALLQKHFIVSDAVGNDVGFSAVSRNYEYSGIRITARPDENKIIVMICYKDALLNKKSESVIRRNFGNFFEVSDMDGAWMCISEELKTHGEIDKIVKTLGDAYSAAVLVE
jgi:hypothetical protein